MEVTLSPDAVKVLAGLAKGKGSDPTRLKKIRKTLAMLAADHRHPGLNSHRYENLDDEFGAAIWESYVENHTPSAWRVWWYFGPEHGQIYVVDIGPHP